MELLAPVGSKESLITAIRAGADAVYVGVEGFNARMSASNINAFDLRVFTGYCREKDVKIYLALNTLIKHEEIYDVVKRIAFINELSPDAVIIQDMGIASIIKKYFPDVTLHASTQLAVHNSLGVQFLARQGFKRVILARELSFSELKSIALNSPVPLEVFCHGALCFSLSGMCLFSSFIGGLSGNRGRCTQPCRRIWEQGEKRGYIFSPKDLELAEHINDLKKIGITALKIEGRMRSHEYVYKTVKAYRLLIDAAEPDFAKALKEAKYILSSDTAREKTACLFSGRDNDIFQPLKAQCLGNLIGKITGISKGSLSVEVSNDAVQIVSGDRLRLSNPVTDTTVAFKVKEVSKEGLKYTVPCEKSGGFTTGNPVYKTVDAIFDQKNIEKDIDAMYKNYKNKNSNRKRTETPVPQTFTSLISNKWKETKKRSLDGESGDHLRVRFDDILWLDVLPGPSKNTGYIFYLTKDNMHLAAKIPDDIAPEISGELPPFIGQRDIPVFRQCMDKLMARGVKKWVLNNISQFGFFEDSGCELSAGPFLYTWNAYTAAALSDEGIKYFTASWEDDFLNIRKMCGPGLGKYMVVYLYGFIPVVRSRILTKEILGEKMITERARDSGADDGCTLLSFSPVYESKLALLIPAKPVSLFTARRKFHECGINNFGIDLSFIKPDKKLWNNIIDAYNRQENIPDSVRFNFRRGIK